MEQMVTLHDMIWGVVLPFVLSAIVVVVSAAPWRRPRTTARWAIPVALALGFWFAYVGIAGRPAFPPIEAQGWLPYLAALAALVSIVNALVPKARWLNVALSAMTLAATVFLITRPLHGRLAPVQLWLTLGIIGAGMFIWWALLEALAHRVPGAPVPALLMFTAIAAALVLMNSHTQRLAQLSGSAAVVLAGAVLLSWWAKLTPIGGTVLTFTIIVLGLVVAGYFYADITIPHAILLAAAPLTAWIGQLPGIRQRRRLSLAVSAIAFLAVLAFVLVPTIQGLHQTYKEQMESTDY
jgi:hypothetical protein